MLPDEKEQRLDHSLQHVREKIISTDMRELVSEEHLELGGGESRNETRRKNDYRPQPSDDHGHCHVCPFERTNCARDAELIRYPRDQAKHAIRCRRSVTSDATRSRDASDHSYGEQHEAERPRRDDPRKDRLDVTENRSWRFECGPW